MSAEPSTTQENYIITYGYVSENKYLSYGEKYLLSLIFGLSIRYGYSDAKNDYLAQRLGTTENAIKMMLSSLLKKGLIEIKDSNKKKRERKITIPHLDKFTKPTQKAMSSITPEPELVEGIIEDEKPVDKYAHFVPEKKAPRDTTIINIANVTLTPKMREYAQKKGYDDAQTEYIFEHFLSHHGSKGSEFKNWDLAFNTWLLNQKQYTKKNFSNAPAQARPSSSPSPAERIMVENMLLEEHEVINRAMMGKRIYISDVMMGTKSIPDELSRYGLTTIRTIKEGVKTIWYDKSKVAQDTRRDDIITVEAIENKE